MKKYLSIIIVSILLIVSFGQSFSVSANPASGGPFSSSLRLQNMSATEIATVTVTLYRPDGTVAITVGPNTIAPYDVLQVMFPDSLARGEYSAVVSSDQPLASRSTFSDSDSSAAYTGFSQGALEWFVPGLYNNYYQYFSNVYVQNVSNSPTNITLEIFAPGSSMPVYTNTKSNVQPFASVSWSQEGVSQLQRNVFYAGRITSSGGDIVAIANVYGSGSVGPQLLSYNGYESGGTKWFTPVLVNNYWSWNASLIIQNTESNAANVTVNYSTGLSKSYNIPAMSVISIYLPHEPLPRGRNGLFAAEITSNRNVVVMVNQGNDTNNSAATYNAFLDGSSTVFAPGVMKRAGLFSTSITCQNVGSSPTTMEVKYSGQPGATSTSPVIPVGGTHIWYTPHANLPNGYDGGAVITSTGDIACIINRNTEDEPYFSMNWDMFTSASGINQ